jgi:hypothetical protein
MISKTFNKIAAKTFAKNPKAHILQPKSINLHFENSLTPEFKYLNFTNLSAVNFNIREEAEKSQFVLAVQMYSYNHVQEMDIAAFKTKEEAETALNEVRVTLYTPTKSFTKWLALITFIGALGCMAHCHILGFKSGMFNMSSTNQEVAKKEVTAATPTVSGVNPSSVAGIVMPPMSAGMNPKDIPPPVSDGEIDTIINQLQQVKQLQDTVKKQQDLQQQQGQQQPQQQQPQQAQAPVNPAEQFLNGLK